MAKVLLGVTGSVAAIHTPLLFADLKKAGHQVKVVATTPSLYFFAAAALDPILDGPTPRRNPQVVALDEDEWPGCEQGQLYERGDQVVHIELRRWADLFLVAPLDANTLAKLASGLADNCLTCVWRAWDRGRPVVLAPAMNTLMWEHPLTRRHFRTLADDFSGTLPPAELPLEDLLDWINRRCPNLRVVPPISKRLACDDVGVGALAEREKIVAAVGQVSENTRRE
jgi:phosphopantothenoylcysteine decarboxylase